MTTFARIAKILNGEIQPKNWIESLFARFANSATHNELPTYSISDENKVLTVEKDEGHPITVNIINEQSVTTNASGRADLAANSWDFSGLVDNEEVTIVIDGVDSTFSFLEGSLWGANDEQITAAGRLLGFSRSATFTISCSKTVTEYEPVLGWKAASGGGVLVISVDGQTGAMNKTFAEIVSANFAIVKYSDGGDIRTTIVIDTFSNPPSEYGVTVAFPDLDGSDTIEWGRINFMASSENGYPVVDEK